VLFYDATYMRVKHVWKYSFFLMVVSVGAAANNWLWLSLSWSLITSSVVSMVE
jgi:hypothetical protein